MAKEGPGDGSPTCIEVFSSAICPFGLFSCEIPNNLLASVLRPLAIFYGEDSGLELVFATHRFPKLAL